MKGQSFKSTILLFFLFQPGLSGQNLDINLLKHINLDRNKSLDGTFSFVTNSAGPVSFGVPVIICGTGFLKHDSLIVRNSLNIGSALVVTVIITTVAKYTVNRTRPFIKYPYIEKEAAGGSPSFPSGHTSEAFALATSVSLTYSKWYVIAPSLLWAGAVGYSRMDLGVHYPSDVLAGAIIGSGCSWITFKVNQRLYNKPGRNKRAAI